MKREYLKPEVFSKEQLNLNEAVAATCHITPIYRVQDSSERRIIGQVIPGNYANYGYANKLEAYGTRLGEASTAQSIDFGLVGPIYQVVFTSDGGVVQSFFWEDFNENGLYDTNYTKVNDVEEVLGPYYPSDPRIVNKEVTTNDNFQSVDGGTITPTANMVDPTTGKVIQS